MKLKKIIIWLLLGTLALLAVLAISTWQPQREKIKIAIAAPLSKVGQTTLLGGEAMVKGTQLYLDRLNQAGGIQGKKVELEIYDDGNDPRQATRIARKIVNSSALAVIGHYSSSTSIAAGKIYQTQGIPAITGSATADDVTQANNWYFSTIFINSDQGITIGNYINKILEQPKISLVYSNDSYGATLAESTTGVLQELDEKIAKRWLLETEADSDRIVAELVAMQQSDRDPGVIVICTSRENAARLIAKMRLKGLKHPIFGGDSLAALASSPEFAARTISNKNPGFFTDNIYALTPIVFDIAGEAGQEFRNHYQEAYDSLPGWTAATYYDAAHAVTAAIAAALNGPEQSLATAIAERDSQQSRFLVRQALAELNSIDTTVQSAIDGANFFTSQGNIAPNISVGIFDRGEFISAYTQLQSIPNLKIIENFQQQLKAGKIIQVGKKYLRQTDIVYTGIDINKVSNIDEKTSTYLIDFYLWFRYQGKDINPEAIEFSNYGTERLDSGEKISLDEPLAVREQDGINYQLYRIKADFKEKFNFHSYPFDNQTLAIRFRHGTLTRDKLIYAVDYIGMKETTTQAILAKWHKGKVFEEISEWIVNRVGFYPDILTNLSTLGDRRFVDTNSQIKYSRFNAVIDIKRNILSFSIKELLPLMFFVVVAYFMLFLPFEQISVEAVSGLLLAVVFYHLSLIEKLPEGIGYVVALDYAFYTIYGLLGLELLLVTVGHSKWFTSGNYQNEQLMGFGRITFPLFLLTSLTLIVWQYSL